MPRHDAVFVGRSQPHGGNESLPHARAVGAHGKRVGVGIPAVEIPDHRDLPGVWSPQRKAAPGRAVDRLQVRAELVVQTTMCAFPKQVNVVSAQPCSTAFGRR